MEIQDTRFWAKVDKTPDHWLWSGALNQDGYGHLGRGGRHPRAHRYAWMMATGEVLTKHDTICHVCDIRNCVRTDDEGTYRVGANVYPRRGHLYKATQPANVADRDTKGRGHWATGETHGTHTRPETVTRGEAHAHATLTNDAIRVIRATYTGKHGQLTALARRFNTTPQNIRAIVAGNAWAHVSGTGDPIPDLVFGSRPTGERASRAKLTSTQVREIRQRVAAGAIQRHLAAEYGVSVPTICLVVNRKVYADVP